MSQPATPYDDFKATMEDYVRRASDPSRPRADPVREAVTARMIQAIPAGLAAIERDRARWLAAGPPPPRWGADAFVTHELEDRVARRDDPEIRWLLASFGLLLADLGTIVRNLEALAMRDLDELPWLVAGAMLVEWSSGQLATDALRESLQRVAAQRGDLAAHLSRALAAAPGVLLELWRIAEQVRSDPTAQLPPGPTP